MTIQGYNQTRIVGINTTSPQYTLDVNGSGKFSGPLRTGTVTVTSTSPNYFLDCHGDDSFAGTLNVYD